MLRIAQVENYASDFARFFSTPVLKDLAKSGRSSFVDQVVCGSGALFHLKEKCSYSDLFDEVYEMMSEGYRCEYVFKNEIARQILEGRHSWRDSRLFFELRVAGRIADAVILNGTSTVYEIKTSLDRLDRLESQMQAFTHVFDRAYVVTDSICLDHVERVLPAGVGLLELTAEGVLNELVSSDSHADKFDPQLAFDVLRQEEYTDIIIKNYGSVPSVSAWMVYDECREMFCALRKGVSRNHFDMALRARVPSDHHNSALENAPESLKAAMLKLKLGKGEWASLAAALASPLNSTYV